MNKDMKTDVSERHERHTTLSHGLLPLAAQLALVEAAARARQLSGLERAAVVEDAIRYVRTNWPECFRWK